MRISESELRQFGWGKKARRLLRILEKTPAPCPPRPDADDPHNKEGGAGSDRNAV